jgi:hypothetical protein
MISLYVHYYAALYAAASIPEFVKETRVINGKMTNNANFPTPPVPYATSLSHINDLDTAEQVALKGAKGSAADRNTKLVIVKGDMRLYKGYVQSVADTNVANSKSIIESAGMFAVARGGKTKPELAAKYGKLPATVDLFAKATKGAGAYMWQMSLDQKSWSDLPATVIASTTVTGLTPATVYYFRFRTLTRAGLSDWSTVVSIIAH